MRNTHHLNRPYAGRGARPSSGNPDTDRSAGSLPRKLAHHWRTTSSYPAAGPRQVRPYSSTAVQARLAYGWPA